jgi:hypothetical protein
VTTHIPQHMYIWLASEKAHERQRAVHSCVILLKCLNQDGCLGVSISSLVPVLFTDQENCGHQYHPAAKGSPGPLPPYQSGSLRAPPGRSQPGPMAVGSSGNAPF